METLDSLVTYAYDLTLGGGAFYIGGSLILYLTKRWQQLEPKSKAIQIPLALKAQQSQALELEQPAPRLEMAELLPELLPEPQAALAELEISENVG